MTTEVDNTHGQEPAASRGKRSRRETAPKEQRSGRAPKNPREPKASAKASTKEKAPRGRKAAASANEDPAAPTGPRLFALESRVDLLPPEVRAGRKNEAIAHRMVLALVVVIAVVILGIGGGTVLAVQARAELQAAQSRTAALLVQQQKFGAVRKLQSEIQLVQAGQQVGASTEIDWTAFLAKVRATIGGGLTLDGVSLDSASPLTAYEQSTAPLQGARVATVTVDVTATNLEEIPPWLAQLATLPGVGDVAPGAITLVSGSGSGAAATASGYTASAIIHLDKSAFDGRFIPKGK